MIFIESNVQFCLLLFMYHVLSIFIDIFSRLYLIKHLCFLIFKLYFELLRIVQEYNLYLPTLQIIILLFQTHTDLNSMKYIKFTVIKLHFVLVYVIFYHIYRCTYKVNHIAISNILYTPTFIKTKAINMHV